MESVSNVGVLDKAIHVLRTIEEAGPQTLLELQASTGLPRATLHRLAVALESHGLLRREASGRFCLGLGLVAFGAAAAHSFPIAGLARPRLVALCQQTGESVQLYVREGDRRRCAVSLPSPHGLRWIVSEGALLPLNLGSAGRVLIGELGEYGWVETVEEREAGVASVERAGRATRHRHPRRGQCRWAGRAADPPAGPALRARRRRGGTRDRRQPEQLVAGGGQSRRTAAQAAVPRTLIP